MSVLLILVIVSLIVAVGFLSAFIWAGRDGQFEDDLSPAIRILMEDEKSPVAETSNKINSTENSNEKK